MELDDVWVLHALQHLEFIVNHLLVSANILFQDDLDRNLTLRAVGLTDNAVRASTQCLSEAVSGSVAVVLASNVCLRGARQARTCDHSYRAGRAAC